VQSSAEAKVELSIREAKARFSEAIAAVARGERVTITKYGQPVAEIGLPQRKNKLDFAALDAYRAEMGWEDGALKLPDNFDDPAFSRAVLGLED
jgi:antitoxin (DNA-binding transcriptional repressor) of toxin-antitoxin stability system